MRDFVRAWVANSAPTWLVLTLWCVLALMEPRPTVAGAVVAAAWLATSVVLARSAWRRIRPAGASAKAPAFRTRVAAGVLVPLILGAACTTRVVRLFGEPDREARSLAQASRDGIPVGELLGAVRGRFVAELPLAEGRLRITSRGDGHYRWLDQEGASRELSRAELLAELERRSDLVEGEVGLILMGSVFPRRAALRLAVDAEGLVSSLGPPRAFD